MAIMNRAGRVRAPRLSAGASKKLLGGTQMRVRLDITPAELAHWGVIMNMFKMGVKLAGVETVNQLAFDLRRGIESEVRNTMTVRMKSLLPFFSIRKAPKRSSPGNLGSIVAKVSTMKVKGSGAPRTRFTGWEEQETGARQIRERTHTMQARAGNRVRKVLGGRRLNPRSNKFLKSKDWRSQKNKGQGVRLAQFLTDLRSQNYRKPFIISKGAKTAKGRDVVPGLYMFKGRQSKDPTKGKMELLVFTHKKPRQPRRIRIVTNAVKHVLTTSHIQRVFRSACLSEIRKKMFRVR